ncbi:MAG: hypothetical protein sL5_09250 [Candidatus Mesenet longicola]|uniref:Uncharacterized protein n=1 Tax=Candidatus Mesenet longicola TaxID=1892558 RepID=A0A8J3HVA6_9RICK|nr:MAG: hypothetical protein sGL2_09840 [Candidatus Mesenet longicola]GHM59932.1 MAG: hypothetical protein sL5_09250 [Candidatus Mesenet longicola]
MSGKCNKVLTLTLDTGQEITHNFQDHIGNGKQFELELKSLDGQKLGTFPTHYYFFDKEGHLNGKVLGNGRLLT